MVLTFYLENSLLLLTISKLLGAGRVMMKQEDVMYVVGLMLLAMGMLMLPMSLYILSSVCLNWTYHLPDFILSLKDYLVDHFNLTEISSFWLIFYIFFGFAVLFLTSAIYLSYCIDLMLASPAVKKPEPLQEIERSMHVVKKTLKDRRESLLLVVKLTFIIFLVFMIANMMQWAVTFTAL